MKNEILSLFVLFFTNKEIPKQTESQRPQIDSVLPIGCVSKLDSKDTVLLSAITKYTAKVEEYEIPLLLELRRNDTVFYYVSAFIHSNQIVKNPPNAVSILNKREVLIYNQGKTISDVCQQNLINKYRKILHVDKINVQEGSLPEATRYYTHDPVWAKITVVRNKVIDVNDKGDPSHHIPKLDYSF